MPWANRLLKLTCPGAWWLVIQLNRCQTLGVGLLGNVLTQGGIPRGGGIIRDLTKVFFPKTHLEPGWGGWGFSLTHAFILLKSLRKRHQEHLKCKGIR